jgi:restriction system protein
VTSRGGPISDGGVDLVVVTPFGERLIVQCKQWKTMRVGVKPLRELWGVLGDEKADGAIFVTSGSFSPDAVAFAQGKRLELIDGHRLRGMIAEVKTASLPAAGGTAHVSSGGHSCPRCGSSMVLRTARHGANAGQQFWGCSTYPKCQGTLPATA